MWIYWAEKSQITLKYQILYQTRVFCQIRCYGNVFLVIPENLISGIWSVTNDKSDSIFILIPDKLEEHRMVNRKLFWQKYSIFKVLPWFYLLDNLLQLPTIRSIVWPPFAIPSSSFFPHVHNKLNNSMLWIKPFFCFFVIW